MRFPVVKAAQPKVSYSSGGRSLVIDPSIEELMEYIYRHLASLYPSYEIIATLFFLVCRSIPQYRIPLIVTY